MFGQVPNRISLCAYSYYSGGINDYCPEEISGPTNWITIDPDNNSDEIPDGGVQAPPPTPGFIISKYFTNISLSSGLLGTNLMPGSTIHYEISWSNENIALTNAIIYDKIPENCIYVSNSLSQEVAIGSSTWETQWSTNTNPDQSFNSAVYTSPEPSPAGETKWVRTKCLNLPAGESGYMRFNVTAGYLPAGSRLTNMSYFTCKQAEFLSWDKYGLTAATQYGGRFSYIADAITNLGSTYYFNIAFTNKGNSMLDFPLTILYTNSSTSNHYFNISIVTNDIEISSIYNLDMGDYFAFQVKIIVTNNELTAGDWLDFRIRAQADNNTSATNYLGDDGIRYGGDIGEDWNGNNDTYPGYIYQQGNTNIRLLLQDGAGTAQIEITKSISNIMLGPSTIAGAIPGATIIYKISYSNTGTAGGINTVIYDAISTFVIYKTNYLSPPTIGWTAQYSTNINPGQNYGSTDYTNWYTMMSNFWWRTNLHWIRWKKPLIPVGEEGIIIYRTIIK